MTVFPDLTLTDRLLVTSRIPEPRLDKGLHRLLMAIEEQRRSEETIGTTTPDLPQEVLGRQLAQALAAGNESTASSFAALLRAQAGLAGVHAAIAGALNRAGRSALQARVMARTAEAVLVRLRPGRDILADEQLVVLAAPPGDQHTLSLTALSHELQDAGHTCLVVDDLPLEDLADLVTRRDVHAVIVSAHLPFPEIMARRYFAALRKARPDLLLVVGGPGAAAVRRGPDLVTEETPILLNALNGRANVLTERECEILRDVAEGLTNSEIAEHLGLSPATVKSHLDRVFTKTGTEHRAAAVARALRQGWIG